jgi:Protein tyrosine and serine/threonine kinase
VALVYDSWWKTLITVRLIKTGILHVPFANAYYSPSVRLEKSTIVWILTIFLTTVLLCLVLLIVTYLKMLKHKKECKLRTEFKAGLTAHKNRFMSIDEPVLFPRLEFPEENLKIHEQMGKGEFGVVHRAIARNILPDEEETVVAAKMMKNKLNLQSMQALQAELKIMKRLGRHLNVLSMLGAVTDNIIMSKNVFKQEYL